MKRIVAVASFILVIFILAEILSLLQLRASLSSYAKYWHDRRQTSGQLTYVALGDSAAQGIGANHPDKGYVGLLATQIAQKTGKSVRVINLSVSGAKIRDVINGQLPQLKDIRPDVVTIEIGANDIVRFNAQHFQADYAELAAGLPQGTVVSNMPYFGGRVKRVSQVAQANQIVATEAKQHGLRVADLYTATKTYNSPFNYAADLFHPNNLGYKNWAQAFWDVLKTTV